MQKLLLRRSGAPSCMSLEDANPSSGTLWSDGATAQRWSPAPAPMCPVPEKNRTAGNSHPKPGSHSGDARCQQKQNRHGTCNHPGAGARPAVNNAIFAPLPRATGDFCIYKLRAKTLELINFNRSIGLPDRRPISTCPRSARSLHRVVPHLGHTNTAMRAWVCVAVVAAALLLAVAPRADAKAGVPGSDAAGTGAARRQRSPSHALPLACFCAGERSASAAMGGGGRMSFEGR